MRKTKQQQQQQHEKQKKRTKQELRWKSLQTEASAVLFGVSLSQFSNCKLALCKTFLIIKRMTESCLDLKL